MELACPMCSLVCTSSSVLQEHVELHLEEQPQADGRELLGKAEVVVSSSLRGLGGGGLCAALLRGPAAAPPPGPEQSCQTLPNPRPRLLPALSPSSCVHHAEWLSCLCPRTDRPGLSHVLLGLQRRRLPAGTCGAAFRAGSSRELFRYVSRAEWTSWTGLSKQAKSAATVQFP